MPYAQATQTEWSMQPSGIAAELDEDIARMGPANRGTKPDGSPWDVANDEARGAQGAQLSVIERGIQ